MLQFTLFCVTWMLEQYRFCVRQCLALRFLPWSVHKLVGSFVRKENKMFLNMVLTSSSRHIRQGKCHFNPKKWQQNPKYKWVRLIPGNMNVSIVI